MSGPHKREEAYAARWAAGAWRGATLTTVSGDAYTVVYEGRPGGPAGPDFRDAVLLDRRGERTCGDVELHLRASGWRLHGHDRDPRYTGVLLHVVVHAHRADRLPAYCLGAPVALCGLPGAARAARAAGAAERLR